MILDSASMAGGARPLRRILGIGFASILILSVFTALHWVGLEVGSTLTRIISLSVGIMLVVLIGCMLLLTAAILEDPRTALIAAVLLAMCVPVYATIKRRRFSC